MEIRNRGNILEIDDCRIVFRNFRGEGSKFNREGDRNFSIIIPDEEVANQLKNEGWNIKIKPPRDEDDTPFITLPVKVKYNADGRGPTVHVSAGKSKRTHLTDETISMLDEIDILRVDLDIRPYEWEVNGKTGRTAYLSSMEVMQNIDRFEQRYEDNNDLPF